MENDNRLNLLSDLYNKVRVQTWDEEDFTRHALQPELIHFVQVETLYNDQVITSRFRIPAWDLDRRESQHDYYTYDYWLREVAIPQLVSNLFRMIGQIRNGKKPSV